MKHTRLAAASLSLVFLVCFQAQPFPAYAQDNPPATIARLLDQSGYSYTKAADGIWAIGFKGKALPEFSVVATTHQDIAVLFVILAKKSGFKAAPDLMQKLLKMNADLDRVKIGIDGEGDAFVRVDLSIRRLDLQELKTNIEQVAAAADVVYGAIKPFITEVK
jgi:hypothetical protein